MVAGANNAAPNQWRMNPAPEATHTDGVRRNFDEVGVYEVRDGRIVREQFFY